MGHTTQTAHRIKRAWDAVEEAKQHRSRVIREAVAEGYSQREIAKLVGTSPATICRIAPANSLRPRPRLDE
jgi:Trp operon repressor